MIGLGFVLGRIDLLGENGFHVLNRFVLSVTLPVLTFRTLAMTDPAGLFNLPMVAAVLGGALLIYALAFFIERGLGRSVAEANIVAMGSSYANVAFIGLPIALILFGKDSLPPVAVTIALNASVVFGIGVLVGQISSAGPHEAARGVSRAIRALLTTPMILSAVAGVLWALLIKQALPHPIDLTLEMLGSATTPCALVAIGLFLARPRTEASTSVVGRIALFKLFGQPLVT